MSLLSSWKQSLYPSGRGKVVYILPPGYPPIAGLGGEKAFCSEECRYKQISVDEHKEKIASGVRKQPEYVEPLCSSPMQFPAGMAVA